MGFRRYAITMVCAVAALVAAAAAANVVIDPYGLFGLVRVDGVNAKKAYAYTHKRLAKHQRALRLQPATVLLGNSRVDVGLNPQSPRWPATMQPVANLGIPGDGMERLAESYSFSVQRLRPDTVVIGLDFFDFLFSVPARPEYRLPIASPREADLLSHLPETVFSTTALLDSLKTVWAQRDPFSGAMTDAGFNTMQDYVATVRREGQWPMVDFKNRQHATYLRERSQTLHLPNGEPAEPLINLRDILTQASDRGQRVILFTYPMHGHFYALLAVSGRWPLFEAWKRAVLAEWEAAKARAPGWQSDLWDFALITPVTTEPAPLPGHRDRRMQAYWEPGHFKAELGERLIGQMTGTAADGFGVRLSHKTIDGLLASQRLALSAYADANPEAFAYLQGVCEQAGCMVTPAPGDTVSGRTAAAPAR